MTVANQIGFGVCLALIPYLVCIAVSKAVSIVLGPAGPAPILMPLIDYTALHINGVVTDPQSPTGIDKT
jgi:hypothetical protein